VDLGEVRPEDISVELYHGSLDEDGQRSDGQALPMEQIGTPRDRRAKYTVDMACTRSGRAGYTVRVLPHHDRLPDARDMAMIRWA
jgi:starch phosphorylase